MNKAVIACSKQLVGFNYIVISGQFNADSKNRQGATTNIKMFFNDKRMRFEEQYLGK